MAEHNLWREIFEVPLSGRERTIISILSDGNPTSIAALTMEDPRDPAVQSLVRAQVSRLRRKLAPTGWTITMGVGGKRGTAVRYQLRRA